MAGEHGVNGSGPIDLVARVGAWAIDAVRRIGAATLFMLRVLFASGTSIARPALTVREIYFAGALSLVIIMVSGLFVGMVLGLQGYDTLQTYGSEEKLGVLVALSLVRELGR